MIITVENENWEDEASKFIHFEGQIWESGKIASSAKYRMDKQFQNLLIFGTSIFFQMEKILKIC